jgi:hypothetical protein
MLEAHAIDYKDQAWKQYSIEELGQWVHLFVKRASHRTNGEKRDKDLYDAQNYLLMIQEHINQARAT